MGTIKNKLFINYQVFKKNGNLICWAPYYNKQIFMADMSTIQRDESMNSLMKDYIDVTISLMNFLKAFESILE